MPTYQYACTSCGEQLEAVQKFSDEPLTECPACGGRLRKVFSPVGVVFKGSGFYKTDSRSTGSKKAGDSSAKGDDKSTGDKSTGDKSSGGDKSTPSTDSSMSKTGDASGTKAPASSSPGQVA